MPAPTRRHRARVPCLAALALVALAAPARAEDCSLLPNGYVGAAERDRQRIDQLRSQDAVREGGSPPLLFLRSSDDVARQPCDAAAQLAPVEVRGVLLPGYADDRNDGALWAGAGASTAATAGVVARWRFLSAAVAPTFAWSQNRDYRRRLADATNLPPSTPPVSPDAHPFLAPGIDLPSRMGTGAWTDVEPGQSFVRADLGPVALGFSTESLWWGPGMRDAIVLTNGAPGFPHAFVGTRDPLDIWIGRVAVQVVLGRLSTSEHLFADGHVEHSIFRGGAVSFEPAIAPGLHLGFAHASVGTEQGSIAKSAVEHLFSRGAGAPDGAQNSLASIMARWVIPAARLELYGEYGRDDTASLLDMTMEPERSAAHAFGLQKLATVAGHELRLHFEAVNSFEVPAVNAPLGVPVFYTHGEGTFYSHRGQALGAGVGPAARAQFLAVDLLRGDSRLGFFAERRLRNMRAFYDSFSRLKGRDLELTAGVRQVLSRGALDLDWQAGLGHRWNADFLGTAWQPSLRASVTWWPGRDQPGRIVAK